MAGLKQSETRGWPIILRGRLFVQADKRWDLSNMQSAVKSKAFVEAAGFSSIKNVHDRQADKAWGMPLGAIIGYIDIVGCAPAWRVLFAGDRAAMIPGPPDAPHIASLPASDQLVGQFGEGRYAWIVGKAVKFKEPVKYDYRSKLGIFELHADSVAAVKEQMAASA